MFWTIAYLSFDLFTIWPYLAANAAVPLLAAFKGDLPGAEDAATLKWIATGVFLGSFLPLIFGGKIYNALEKAMIAKLVMVLAYLSFVAIFICSAATAGEIFSGFFRFGTVPIRPQTVIVVDRFTVERVVDGQTYRLRGVFEHGKPNHTNLVIGADSAAKSVPYARVPPELEPMVKEMLAEAGRCAADKRFLLRLDERDTGVHLEIEGSVAGDRDWRAERIVVRESGKEATYAKIDDVPEPFRGRVRKFVDNLGVEPVGIVGYIAERGRLPDLNWAVLAGFAAIAGAGGLTNAQLSNYARDKGWGMGSGPSPAPWGEPR
jgi:hypothetical protein